MSDVAIRVENLSKQYRIGGPQARYKTIRDSLNQAVQAPFRRMSAVVRGQSSVVSDETIWALKDLSFEIERGKVVGIIGRNGAGKTTLLRILSRITEPTEGRVRLRGHVGSLLEVGTGFHPELTGRENIYLNGAILGMRRAEIESKFDEIVAFAEVEKFIDTPVKHFSSGMYVRLAFAVAAHLEPEILLVDEVLEVGDVAFQKKCLGKMGQVAHEGRTVLFVSHNMAAVRTLCSQAMLLKGGHVVADGSTEEVISGYLREGYGDGSPDVDLPSAIPDSPAKGIRLRFLSVNGAPGARFRLGEPWQVRLDFEVFRELPHFIAAVGIKNAEGIPIATYWSKTQDIGVGKYSVTFDVDLPLKAMELRFVVGLSSFERTVHYADGVGHVSISEVAVAEQPIRSSGSGILLTPQVAEIQPLIAGDALLADISGDCGSHVSE